MRLPLAVILALLGAPAAAQVIPSTVEQPGQAEASRIPSGTYNVDPHHTLASWAVNHMGFSILNGLFGASGGSITLDPAQPAESKVDVTFKIAELSVTTPEFREHLQSPDFFDAAKYPTARFVSTSVVAGEGNRATIVGNLTVKDQTRPVTIDAAFVGAGTNPMSRKLNVGFHGTTTIKRSDFGVGFGVPVVSDEVKLDIQAAFAAP